MLLDPAKATGFMNAMLGSMRVDQSMDNAQVLELTRRLARVNPSQVTFRTVPVVGERSMGAIGNVVVWDGPGSSDIFTALRNDTAIPKRPAAPRVEVAPSQISVQLLGTGDTATRAYEDFQAAGYSVASAVPGTYTQTTIEYDPGYDVSLKTLQAALPDAEAVAVPGLGSTFRVTIGDDYTGVTTVSVKDPTESDQPRTANDDICG